jgi:hypothetical protein
MDTKKVIKTVLFFVLVPSVIVGAWYGGKFVKKKYDAWFKKHTDSNSTEVKK